MSDTPQPQLDSMTQQQPSSAPAAPAYSPQPTQNMQSTTSTTEDAKGWFADLKDSIQDFISNNWNKLKGMFKNENKAAGQASQPVRT